MEDEAAALLGPELVEAHGGVALRPQRIVAMDERRTLRRSPRRSAKSLSEIIGFEMDDPRLLALKSPTSTSAPTAGMPP